jgi:hypothetical protein
MALSDEGIGEPVPDVFVLAAYPGDPRAGRRDRDVPGVRGPVCVQDGERTVRDRREDEERKNREEKIGFMEKDRKNSLFLIISPECLRDLDLFE